MEGEFLQDIIRLERPSNTLEVGMAFGFSSYFICQALSEVNGKRHIVMDPWQNDSFHQGIGLNNLRLAELDSMIDFYDEPSFRVLPKLESQGTVIDFAFVDGMVLFDFTLVDFFYIDRLLKVGGIIALRVGWKAAKIKVCQFILRNLPSYIPYRVLPPVPDLDLMDHNDILGPSRKEIDIVAFRKESEDARKWNFHKNF